MAENRNNTTEQLTTTLTPGSDFVFNFRQDQNLLARQSNDTLLGFDPLAPIPTPPLLTELEGSADQFNFNILLGDFIEEDIRPDLFARPDQVPLGQDTFIIGDWRKPYYLDNFALGFQQIAIIADFQPELDTIQLHGSKEDYILIPFALAGPDPDGEFTVVNGEALVWVGSNRFTNKATFDVNEVFDAFQSAGFVENFDEFSTTVKEIYNLEEFEEGTPDAIRRVNFNGVDISEDPEFRFDEDNLSFNFQLDPSSSALGATNAASIQTILGDGLVAEGLDPNFFNFGGEAFKDSREELTKAFEEVQKSREKAAEKDSAGKAAEEIAKGLEKFEEGIEKAEEKAQKEALDAIEDFQKNAGEAAENNPIFDFQLDPNNFAFDPTNAASIQAVLRDSLVAEGISPNFFDFGGEAFKDSREELRKAFEEVQESREKAAEKDSEEKAAEELRKGLEKFEEGIAKAEEKAQKDAIDAIEDFQKDAEKAAEERAKEFNIDIDDVLANTSDFDIVAFFPDVEPSEGLPIGGLPLPDIDLDNGDYFDFVGTTPPIGPFNTNIKQVATAGVDQAIDVTTDEEGNFYVLGNTTGALGDANQGGYDVWIAKYDEKGKQKWIQQYGTAAGDVGWEIEAFASEDGKTNLYLTGATTGSFAQKYDSSAVGNEGYQDVWIARLDDKGEFIWARQNPQPIGGPEIDNSLNIDVDAAGNLYQSGITLERIDSPLIPVQDFAWVAKYNSAGDLQWFNDDSLESTDQVGFDETYGVAVANDGNVFATGFTQNNLGGPRIGVYDLWLSKFDTQGEQIWIEKFGTVNYEFGWGVDTDSQNNAYVAGLTRGDLGGPNQGENDAFITKFDEDGNQQWVRQFGGIGDDGLYLGDITVDGDDNIYVAGFTDSIIAGGETNRGGYDAWVAKYDAAGNQQWVSQFGSSELDFASGLTTDDSGQIYVTGYTQGSLGARNQGSVDAWVTKVNPLTGAIVNFETEVGRA